MDDSHDIFGPDGPLQRALPGFRQRRQQRVVAERVARTMESRGVLVVEAGTGTGKTFAYLVPALLSGLRVLVSTGTRTLQHQLFAKDLPLVAAALGRPVRIALLKGRTNYLCRYRIDAAGTQLELVGEPRPERILARVRRWAATTRTGDLAEVPGLSDSHPVWSQVTSTRENCLGVRCAELSRCHVAAARREAQEADIVIVNHHLLLADLALKQDGFGDLLGAADAVVIDEAHQIPDLATQLFGTSAGSRQLEHLLRDLQILGAPGAGAGASSGAARLAIGAVEESFSALLAAVPRRTGRFAWTEAGPTLESALRELAGSLHALESELQSIAADADADNASGAAQMAERTGGLARPFDALAESAEADGVRTLEVSTRGFSLQILPFDIAERFAALVRAHRSAWIFTSATLSIGEDFSHFTARLGLTDAETLKVESPFDYERQGLLYLPQGLPDPASAGYLESVMALADDLIRASQGGAFVLFTSHRALALGAALLRARWGDERPFGLYVQGESAREQLLAEFRADGSGVLLGTTSFWEGVDVKGDALRLVIIEKLPFASPDDPLVRARIEHIQREGGNAFMEYQVPEAALALKQGVGRLIRSEDDFGAVVICDPRLVARHYGRVFRAALPPMSVTRDIGEIGRFLARHAPHEARRPMAGLA